MGGWVDWVVNPISTAVTTGVGELGKALGGDPKIFNAIETPVTNTLGLLHDKPKAADVPQGVPPPPTPSDPVVATAMNDAAREARKRSPGRASTYLVGKNSPAGLLDQPGTLFRSSLGT